jgi:hypothetical protein
MFWMIVFRMITPSLGPEAASGPGLPIAGILTLWKPDRIGTKP